MVQTAQSDGISPRTLALYVALELSKNTWKLGFTTARNQRARIRNVPAGDLDQFLVEVEAAKAQFGLPAEARVLSCYEAGRDGFWIHRFLEASGIENVILDPASIEVNRRSRRAKTDRLDVQKLVLLLVRHHEGERVVSVLRVPSPEAEDERRFTRQLKRLKKLRGQATSAIRSALVCHGIDLDPRNSDYFEQLAAARQWNGEPLPPGLVQELDLLWEQYTVIKGQIDLLEEQQSKALREARRGSPEATVAQHKAAQLTQLRGVGETGAYQLATELFGWREFNNRKELGALAGLTGTPFCSGTVNRDQGISKAGNPRVRALMVELAWCWVRWQPNSRVIRWYHRRVGEGTSRSKRKAIVAVARKLLVELWHYVEHGVVPEGAVLKAVRKRKTAA